MGLTHTLELVIFPLSIQNFDMSFSTLRGSIELVYPPQPSQLTGSTDLDSPPVTSIYVQSGLLVKYPLNNFPKDCSLWISTEPS